jgi:Amt family ammonium transporter
MSATITSWLIFGKPDLGMTLNGCLAGLVAITAPCAFVSIGSSLIIGFIAGVLVVLSVIVFDKLKIDDPVGALSVHLVNGIFGTLCVGLFAQDKITGISTGNGLFYGGGWSLFLTQLTGVISVGIYTFVISLLIWYLLKVTMGIRVSLQEEIEGLDIGEHGNKAYPEFLTHKPAYSLLKVKEE